MKSRTANVLPVPQTSGSAISVAKNPYTYFSSPAKMIYFFIAMGIRMSLINKHGS